MDRTWQNKYSYQEIDTVPRGSVSTIKDLINSYDYNSDGFRGHNHEGTRFVVAGCSQTFGEGVPFETTWGNRLAQGLGYSTHANIGIRGASLMAIVTRVFGYIEQYGIPDYIFLLAPDLLRAEYPLDDTTNSSLWNSGDTGFRHIHLPRRGQPRPKYVKRPYEVEYVLSHEFVDTLNMDYLRFLDLFCRTSRVDFKWSTWSVEFQNLYEAQGGAMESYVSFKNLLGLFKNDQSGHLETCHQDLRDLYKENFYIGADHLADPNEIGHMGVHQHAHIAEAFLESLS